MKMEDSITDGPYYEEETPERQEAPFERDYSLVDDAKDITIATLQATLEVIGQCAKLGADFLEQQSTDDRWVLCRDSDSDTWLAYRPNDPKVKLPWNQRVFVREEGHE